MAAPGIPSKVSMRPRISAAALLVNVTARMLLGEAPSTWINQATRWTSTRVLPLPAPASTKAAPAGEATACRWASLSPSRRCDTSIRPRIVLLHAAASRLLGELDQRKRKGEHHGP